MEEKSTVSVLDFLKGEISFTEWLEKKQDESGAGEEKDSDGEDDPREPLLTATPSERGNRIRFSQKFTFEILHFSALPCST